MNKILSALFLSFCFSSAVWAQQVQLTLNTADNKITISRFIYGHFSEHLGRCIYDGFWVGDSVKVPKKDRIRLDIVDALKRIQIPVLRWPGGCFADEYHWRDGVGPRAKRPKMVNTNWGGVTEDNSFGTNEFLELCSLLNCEPYISGNVGSGTVEEMDKWVEYLNFDGESPMANERKANGHPKPYNVHFWGIGNEAWGCGGNMTAEYYSDVFRRYASYCKNYPNARLSKVASGANSGDYHWTETLMKNVPHGMMWGVGLHYYTIPTGSWRNKGSATKFDEKEYFSTMKNCLRMEELVSKHSAIMDKYDSAKRVALAVDEWGIWTDVEPGTNPAFLYQQNSLRDALVAATTLNIFNNHADRVRLANLAQTVNVLQALVLTKGSQMLLTPTYYVFDLYKVHQDAKLVPVKFESPDYTNGDAKIPALNVSASKDSTGALHISLVNLDPAKNISLQTSLDGAWKNVSGRIITSEKLTDINTFEQQKKVIAAAFNGAKLSANKLSIELPAKSIVTLELR
ncbi:alpha-N-arabinofuranosidase [Flavisolibacter ginsenosidimutans]|uniref:non-reducing end alpha-L-arabinofuranosidase n=1 Tax=Flavisolibacter ginsenosidimutans TaxID=661481 RepID=A0A5B8UFV1_9BACT|nr:alpha-L-arabinofuranosidase C-terminal domain-containing protein [Flavisolibacter ginsenosidimutans]QEC55255.1 alpha-N-arabinofuranosidase [Flavisolibacter ginsenosidimutans]